MVEVAVDLLPVEGDLAHLHPALEVAFVSHNRRDCVLVVCPQLLVLGRVEVGAESLWLPADSILVFVGELELVAHWVMITVGSFG